jgi:replication-associated recombination protein RarA
MQSLVEKYKPSKIDAFAGLVKPRAILKAVAGNPYESAWLFLGPSGIGKTTMALAFAEAIGGELHHIPSKACDLATVEELCKHCWYKPFFGDWHVILVDEADQMTKAAQLAFLSKLDTTAKPPNTIFIFTANDTKGLEDRFLSRTRTLQFDPPSKDEAAQWVADVWAKEMPGRPVPDCAELVESADGNMRAALMNLELELIVARSQKPKLVAQTDQWGRTAYVPVFA